jgi:hypothetical protein
MHNSIFKAKIITSVFLILILAGSLSAISNFLINSKIDCKVNSCSKLFDENQVIQSVEVSFLNKSGENREKIETKNSIEISQSQNNISISIPQLKPEFSNLKVELKDVQENSKITIRVNESRSVYVFVDEKIAYSHRYEMPVFQINPIQIISYQGIDLSTQNLSTNYIAKNPGFLEIGRILLVLILILTITYLISLNYQKPSLPFLHSELHKPWFVYGIAFFWIASIVITFRKPFDPVGAQNPGLFGPIGAAFSDYFQISQIGQFNKPYELGGVNYPPAALMFGKILFGAFPGLPGFVLFASASLGLIFYLVRKSGIIKSLRTALPVVLFYPLIFGLVRGNFDIVAVCLIFYSINFADKFNGRVSALLLALAVAIKIWPIVFILYFYKWKNKKLVYETLAYTFLLTMFSAYLLGYSHLNEIFEVVSSSFFYADNVTTQAFHYCYSLTSIIFFAHLFLTADSPWNPLKFEVQDSVMFTDGIFAKFILALLLLLLVTAVFKTRSKRQTFLFLSGIALLLPTPSYTYRGAILLGCFILFNYDSLEGKSKKSKGDEFLRKTQLCMWIPIFAPGVFFFARNSEISTASLLQPLALLIVLGIEMYLLFSQGSYFQRKHLFSRIKS